MVMCDGDDDGGDHHVLVTIYTHSLSLSLSVTLHAPVGPQRGQGVVGRRGGQVEADGHRDALRRGEVPRQKQRPVVLGALVAVCCVGGGWFELDGELKGLNSDTFVCRTGNWRPID
jgi:hypothetical protein